MIFKSGSGSSWYLDLADESELKKELPMNNLVVKNNSDYTIDIYINDTLEMVIESRNTDTKIGKNFRTLTLVSESSFSDNEIIIDVGKNVQTTLTPYNPAWDALQTDFSKYASGCDSRISLSTTNTLQLLTMILNSNYNTCVMNRLDLKGSASIGNYEITLDDDTSLTGSVPLNGTILDSKRYLWNNNDSLFDTSFTNCSLGGLIVDYKTRDSYFLNKNITVDAPNMYDNDWNSSNSFSSSLTAFECLFDDELIKNTYLYQYSRSRFVESTIKIYYKDVDDVWQLIDTISIAAGDTYYYRYNTTAINQIARGLKVVVAEGGGAQITVYLKEFKVRI